MVQPALPPSAGHLELPPLRPRLGPCAGVVVARRGTEVLARLPLGPVSLQEEALIARRALERELVEGHDLAAGREDPRARGLRELESAHGHLRDRQKALVVDDFADDDSDRRVLLPLQRRCEAGDGERAAVCV